MKMRKVLYYFLLIWPIILACTSIEDGKTDTIVPATSKEPMSASAESQPDPVKASTGQRGFATGQYGSKITGTSNPTSSDAVGRNRSAGSAGSYRTGKRILIVDCLMDGSHTHIQRIIAIELASRGHNVTWLTNEMLMYWPTQRDRELINFRVFETSLTRERLTRNLDYWTRKSISGELASFSWYVKMWLGWTDDEMKDIFQSMTMALSELLHNTDFDELRAANFDMVLCEVMLPVCSSIAHDILKVPFINTINGGYLGTRYSRWFNQPSPLSYVPEFVTGYTDAMTFPQRVKNFLTHAMSLVIYDYVLFAGVDRARADFGLDASTGTKELMSRAELFIYNWDFSLEFPRPVTPNSIMIGGLTITQPKPLPQVLEEFIQGSGEHGIVVFSVSTLFHAMDMELANMIGAALARLPQRVIWKYLDEEKPATLGNNTMAIPWISQQDLVAHEKTRLLIYHGGLNGGYEAMYYGVPVLGIPLFTDQVDDMVRLKHRIGMADYFAAGIRGLTSERLYQGIQEVMGNPSYRQNAQRASSMLRDVQTLEQGLPLNRTARWIEYAINHGTTHMRTRTESLAWYQYFLLDVIGAYAVWMIALLWLVKRCWCRLCTRKGIQ